MPAPERLTVTEDSNCTTTDGLTLKSLLGTTDTTQNPTTYYSFTCLDNSSILSLPLSHSQLMILLVSLRKLKLSGENTYAFSQHLPTCEICAGPVSSPIAVEEWPRSTEAHPFPSFQEYGPSNFVLSSLHHQSFPFHRIIPGWIHAFAAAMLLLCHFSRVWLCATP